MGTRAQNRAESRKRRPHIAWQAVAAGILLTENPNAGKRKASPSASAETRLQRALVEPETSKSFGHKPLTVATPLRTEKRGRQVIRGGVPQSSRYTI